MSVASCCRIAWVTPWTRHDWFHTAAIGSTHCHSQTVDYAWCACPNRTSSRCLSSANIPATKESWSLLWSDRKRPDGLILIPWKNGGGVTWDVIVNDTLERSHLPATSGSSGVSWKMAKCVAVETLAPVNNLSRLGRRVSQSELVVSSAWRSSCNYWKPGTYVLDK